MPPPWQGKRPQKRVVALYEWASIQVLLDGAVNWTGKAVLETTCIINPVFSYIDFDRFAFVGNWSICMRIVVGEKEQGWLDQSLFALFDFFKRPQWVSIDHCARIISFVIDFSFSSLRTLSLLTGSIIHNVEHMCLYLCTWQIKCMPCLGYKYMLCTTNTFD